MKWLLAVLLVWAAGGPVLGQHRYWDADYDSLARALAQQRTDTARLRTVRHLLDLHPTGARALPLLDQLLALNHREQTINDQPYQRLRAGLQLWQREAHAAALDTLKVAVAEFDAEHRPIPWLLIDMVMLYNQLNRMEARKRYYGQKLAYYRVHNAPENTAACYLSQGAYYRRIGDYNRAINNSLRAADMAQGFSRKLHINELLVTGAIYTDWQNPGRAVHYLNEARALPEFRRVQGTNRVFTFLALSKLYLQQRKYPEALQAVDSALATRVADGVESSMSQAHGLVQKGDVLLRMQQTEPAGRLLQRAQQLNDSLNLHMSDKPGEMELDATWARYYVARRADARAEAHWLVAYHKATAAELEGLQIKYLRELSAFYDARARPVEAQRYAREYIALTDAFNAAQASFHVAQYESERVEQAQGAQINNLRQAQAVQAERLRLGNRMLLGALLAVLLVSGLGAFIYRQLQTNRRTLAKLRHAQSQLVQAEKMAFLGELTAGIAHELQNPLNFMKNFAEVSSDLVEDMHGNNAGRDAGLEGEILIGLKQNLQQISQHGQRASSIIKDMLEHSRSGTSLREPADLNRLAEESLGLAYDGLCANDKTFHATLERELEPKLGLVNLVPQDMGRVLLNLCTNALHAVRQRQRHMSAEEQLLYEPTVTVSTRRPTARAVEIRVRDNGVGMSEAVQAKIFQPFFTTKPAGEGTGLGLSLSHDIVTKGHGGTLTVESREGHGTEFLITLPQ
ncbi:MAG TPA: ATP-binding protein [Hymenobacter sp.]|uniref:ATP-binding protein n=1 Tax=Hymenobacter sp. TaxID=1898978 RepID=UPI002EDA901C